MKTYTTSETSNEVDNLGELVYKVLLVFDRVGVGPLVLQQGVVFSALLLGFVALLLSLHFINDLFL